MQGEDAIPANEKNPPKLKINRWAVNSPYLDALFTNQAAHINNDNIEVEPNAQALNQALMKIGDLFDRLVRENKITPIKLLEYDDWSNHALRNEFEGVKNQYDNFVDFVKKRHPGQYDQLRFAKKENVIGDFGIFKHTARTKNRAIALANDLIWNGNVQVIPDDEAALMLARLAIGGKHCWTRAEEDTAWAVIKASKQAVAASDDPLELKMAALMLNLKKQAVEAMIDVEKYSHGVHTRTIIERHLAPHIGWTPGTENFQEDNWGNRFVALPIEEGLAKFYAQFTQEFIEESLVSDIRKAFSKKEKEQATATIKLADLDAYVDRVMPEGSKTLPAAGLVDETEDGMDYEFTRNNARNLLRRLGYLEKDD